MIERHTAAVALALWVGVVSQASAKLVGIEYRIPGNLASHSDTEGGPLWSGIVDTTLDILTLYTWIEQPNSIDYWSPTAASMPLVWPAVGDTGASFDVPDTFDGSIDGTFAFISPQNVHDIEWSQEANEGGLLLPFVATFYPGWGKARRYIPNQQTELVYDTSWDEEHMPRLLTSPNGLGIVAADDGVVSLVEHGSISSVPEASPVLVGILLSAGGLVQLWRRRLRKRAC